MILPPLIGFTYLCVIQARLQRFIHELKKILGIHYIVYVIEFQKRGLPHAHIIVKVLYIFYCCIIL